MAEFTIDGKAYKSGRLDAFKQSHIVRRLAPLVGALAPALRVFKTDPMAALQLVTSALAKLSDEDVEYVQKACLCVVERQNAGIWSPVLPRGGVLAFDDIGLLELNEITFNVLQDNLTPFFSGIGRRGWSVPE